MDKKYNTLQSAILEDAYKNSDSKKYISLKKMYVENIIKKLKGNE
jgi:hypothetical protein